jgi:serine/threonine protein kinase
MYLGMEYVGGPNLQAAIGWDGPFHVADAIRIIAQLAAALAYAHARGIVHRDLKPANVILADGDPGRAKIIDFGLAKIAADEGLTRLTDDSELVGSPLYWAPEQSTSAAVGPPADVYSLGGIAYFVLTGEPMFRSRPAVAMVYAHAHEEPPALAERCRDVELPPGLDELIRACVAKAPAERPAAAYLAAELQRLLAAAPATSSSPRRAEKLFTITGLSNMEQAITNQIRQVLLDLASVLDRPTDAIDGAQNELSELELELAMLESDAMTDPRANARRDAIAARVAELHAEVADAYRALFDAVNVARGRAPADAKPLFAELDGLVERFRTP